MEAQVFEDLPRLEQPVVLALLELRGKGQSERRVEREPLVEQAMRREVEEVRVGRGLFRVLLRRLVAEVDLGAGKEPGDLPDLVARGRQRLQLETTTQREPSCAIRDGCAGSAGNLWIPGVPERDQSPGTGIAHRPPVPPGLLVNRRGGDEMDRPPLRQV